MNFPHGRSAVRERGQALCLEVQGVVSLLVELSLSNHRVPCTALTMLLCRGWEEEMQGGEKEATNKMVLNREQKMHSESEMKIKMKGLMFQNNT